MIIETNKQRGNAGLSLAIAYFGTNGYTVSLPLNDTQWYDLIVEKDGEFKTIQCKFTSSDSGEIELISKGGTKGTKYGSIFDNALDYLFCANHLGQMWLVPMNDIIEAGNKKSIRLRTEPNSNNQGFNTYSYLVQI